MGVRDSGSAQRSRLTHVVHVYNMRAGLIDRMDVEEPATCPWR